MAGNQQRAKYIHWKTSSTEQLLYGKGTLRHVSGMLQHHGVTGHQCGCNTAEYLPEGKIPGHHRQHSTERLILHIAQGCVSDDPVARQKLSPVFGVVLTAPSALFNFRLRFNQQFTHFQRYQPRQHLPPRAQQFRQLA